MFNINKNNIYEHIKNLTKKDIFNFATKYNIYLNKKELDFVYSFIKNNSESFINNPKNFNINDYKNNFTENNFNKLNTLYNKYSNYLNIIKITD